MLEQRSPLEQLRDELRQRRQAGQCRLYCGLDPAAVVDRTGWAVVER